MNKPMNFHFPRAKMFIFKKFQKDRERVVSTITGILVKKDKFLMYKKILEELRTIIK